tara:strand:- start:290 stop:2002 length:1713 start_codon:yes stop_codon:yes gene_type:complete
MIPDIPISEIGWSDVSTVKDEEGKEQTILGPQRALLQQYLDNIGSPGGTFAEQIASLQEFYGPGGAQQLMSSATTPAEAIAKLVSYLVFYKTLTKVVTNFNASSAGFSFESFLAVLLNGKQIEANTGTIADFLTGDDIPVSLKLYTKLHVGGSWRDLVKDITDPQFSHPWKGKDGAQGNAMRYVSGIKTLSGAGLKQKGEINLYQFDITLDNIVDIMLGSMHPDVVKMPLSLIQGGADVAAMIPSAEQAPSNEEMETMLTDAFYENLPKIEVPEILKQIAPDFPNADFLDQPNGIFDTLAYPKEPKEGPQNVFNKWKGLALTPMTIRGSVNQNTLVYTNIIEPVFLSKYSENTTYLNASKGEKKLITAYLKTLGIVIAKIHNNIVDKYSNTEIARAREAALSTVEWPSVRFGNKGETEYNEKVEATHEEIKEFYDGLDAEGKKGALKNTYGILASGTKSAVNQWDLNEKQATDSSYPVEAIHLGELRIGGAYVEAMLKEVGKLLNEEIFSVFTSLKTLSDSLNSFFAGGLSDDGKALEAITSAQDIQKKTAESSGVDPRQLGLPGIGQEE